MVPYYELCHGSVSKLNRSIPSSAVEAGFACPKTQSKLFSGERTSPCEPNDSIIHVLTQPQVVLIIDINHIKF